MDIGAVMDELAVALNTIPTLRAHGYFPERVTTPAAVIDFPDIAHDATFARGSDRITLPVVVLVARVDSRTARDRLLSLQAQVKAVIEDHEPTSYDSARVTAAEFNHSYALAGVEHSAAQFSVDIIGTGV